MDNLLVYLLKTSAGTALLYLGFLIFFSKDTFYFRNRIFIILVLLLPIIIPFIKVPMGSIGFANYITVENYSSISSHVSESLSAPLYTTLVENSFNYHPLIFWTYVIISGIFLIRVMLSILVTYRIINKGVAIGNGFPRAIRTNQDVPPFSFFPFIVIPEKEMNGDNFHDLMNHESAHVRQGHTFDQLLCEIILVFQWYNPFLWLVKRSMKLNHEYLADRYLLNQSVDKKEYQMKLLRFQTGQRHIAFAHSFNSLIKNRIIMINKKPTRIFAALKNLFILPLFALAAMAFAVPKTYYNADINTYKAVKGVVLNEENKPMFGATVAVTGSNVLTATDQKGQFTLTDIPENASLSFEFFGFKQVKMAAEFSKEMTVHMQKDYGLSPSDIKVVPPPKSSNNQSAPLRIVDGVEMDNKTFVDPNLFFAAKFIKDKEATAIYGEKGKNGVLLVMLKKK